MTPGESWAPSGADLTNKGKSSLGFLGNVMRGLPQSPQIPVASSTVIGLSVIERNVRPASQNFKRSEVAVFSFRGGRFRSSSLRLLDRDCALGEWLPVKPLSLTLAVR